VAPRPRRTIAARRIDLSSCPNCPLKMGLIPLPPPSQLPTSPHPYPNSPTDVRPQGVVRHSIFGSRVAVPGPWLVGGRAAGAVCGPGVPGAQPSVLQPERVGGVGGWGGVGGSLRACVFVRWAVRLRPVHHSAGSHVRHVWRVLTDAVPWAGMRRPSWTLQGPSTGWACCQGCQTPLRP
jgi:hypothetical protein